MLRLRDNDLGTYIPHEFRLNDGRLVSVRIYGYGHFTYKVWIEGEEIPGTFCRFNVDSTERIIKRIDILGRMAIFDGLTDAASDVERIVRKNFDRSLANVLTASSIGDAQN